jgi:hypothetical protein
MKALFSIVLMGLFGALAPALASEGGVWVGPWFFQCFNLPAKNGETARPEGFQSVNLQIANLVREQGLKSVNDRGGKEAFCAQYRENLNMAPATQIQALISVRDALVERIATEGLAKYSACLDGVELYDRIRYLKELCAR